MQREDKGEGGRLAGDAACLSPEAAPLRVRYGKRRYALPFVMLRSAATEASLLGAQLMRRPCNGQAGRDSSQMSRLPSGLAQNDNARA